MLLPRRNDPLQTGMYSYRRLQYRPLLSAEEAIEEANEHLVKNTLDTEMLLKRAKSLMRLRRHSAAHADFSILVKSFQGNGTPVETVNLLFYRGLCCEKMSRIDDAIADFTAALDIVPSHKRSAYERAACHNKKGNFTAAILDYERALQYDVGRNNFLMCRNTRSRFAKARLQQLSVSLSRVTSPVRATSSSSVLGVDGTSTNGDNKKLTFASPLDIRATTSGFMDDTLRLNHPISTSGSPEWNQTVLSSSSSLSSSTVRNSETAGQHHQRGLAYRKKGDLIHAINEYTAAIQLDPKNFKALFNRGFCHDKIGDYDAAIRDYEAAIELEPRYAYTYYNLGISYDRRGDNFEEAIAMFDKAISLDNTNADFYHNRGFSQRKLGKYREAIRDYTTALSLDAQHFKAYYNRAFCYDKLGEITNAIEDYTNAIAIHTNNPNAYHNRGAALEKIGRLKDAIKDYTEAIKLDGENPFTYNARGVAYDRIGMYDAALQDLTKAIVLSSNNVLFYQNRGATYQNMECFPEALRDYDVSLKLVEQYENKKSGMISDRKKVEEINTTRIKIFSNRGFCHARQSNYEAAVQDLSTVISVDPDNILALYNRGICYDKLGNHKYAVEDFSRIIEMDAGNADAHYSRGSALESLEEYAAALSDYAVALALDVDKSNLTDPKSLAKFKAEHRAAVASKRVFQLLNNQEGGYLNTRNFS
ncbi:Tetratricopeptide repeat [Trypanosoma melophagium]|uniref:Tetratricopeptide repeat n=1 Tax=Trypanosoma melophagium TaxID=715481 RepID=UPI00351A840E|nr:Tetratricopeptide repeat [Trypanosoma melophagium]